MIYRNRVFTYITNGGHLLVFDHVDFPNAGTQIPGGTIEPGETPEAAALREAREETGLGSLSIRSFIANETVDLTPFGKLETINGWFYHLEYDGERQDRWRYAEQTPGDGSLEPILFELYWISLQEMITLNAVDNRYLDQIREILKSGVR
ncbi:NUDIX hydrolase [Gimesia fumaroli]|uniref:Nucleoside triphosphate pyrophosphohydrolase n=1 Tax=Gimesia fumaroli TaxID=2527976 RepID=A0A518I7G4_9PLAN|nr:NUDIX domain-containing protein [Gimesia fumaroli]QDV49035.1 nucleoside triphosphate pyrophosphohydrolase [Gimesia fumaroli]